MRRLAGTWGLLLALLVFLGAAGAGLAQPKFPALTGRVVDDAHLLSAQTAQKLDGELANLEAQTGHQLVLATVPDLQGYPIEDYGYQLGRTWGIGRKGQNDGVVFLVAPKERKVRIEVGYGLEPVLTDALSNVILHQKVLPRFQEGKLEQGVVDGVEAVIQQLALPEDQARANVARADQARQPAGGGGIPFGAIIAILVIFFVLSSLLRGFGRRGGGGGLWWLLPLILSSGGRDRGGGGWGGGGGGFSGGGGSFGGGGSSGDW